jgi:organic hydroperoxide reductase OsmC/OhrA
LRHNIAMSIYTATIHWTREAQPFLDHRYSRVHSLSFDGGVVLAGSSSPQVVPLPFSEAAAVDPEETFVASLSSCHMLWFLDFAARAGWLVDDYTDAATGILARNASGQMAMTQVTLNPVVRFASGKAPSESVHADLHHKAHAACFIANSVKTEVLCHPRLVVTA